MAGCGFLFLPFFRSARIVFRPAVGATGARKSRRKPFAPFASSVPALHPWRNATGGPVRALCERGGAGDLIFYSLSAVHYWSDLVCSWSLQARPLRLLIMAGSRLYREIVVRGGLCCLYPCHDRNGAEISRREYETKRGYGRAGPRAVDSL